jgi:hypothetical protein
MVASILRLCCSGLSIICALSKQHMLLAADMSAFLGVVGPE